MFCFVDGTDPGDKKTADSRKQRAFAIIALNLSRSCRDCLRHLNSRDPKEAWGAVLARFEQTSAATKMALLDSLLGLRCGNSVLDYVSKFNEYVNRLTSMEETLGKDLKVAIFLRGLPTKYQYLVSMIKVREKLPEVDEVIRLVFLETQAGTDVPGGEALTVNTVQCTHWIHEPAKCWWLHPELTPICHNCRQRGHLRRNCPNGKGGAIDSQTMTATTNSVKQGYTDKAYKLRDNKVGHACVYVDTLGQHFPLSRSWLDEVRSHTLPSNKQPLTRRKAHSVSCGSPSNPTWAKRIWTMKILVLGLNFKLAFWICSH
jgi:hypothetical protein